jgi:membrane fusion protein (multidrug efflux system)
MNKTLFGGLILLFLSTACSEKNVENTEPEEFKVFTPLVVDTTAYEDYICDIKSVNNVEIRTRVKGYIESVNTDEGKFVRKGQLLFKISSQEYKEELLKSRAVLKSAQADLKQAEIDMANVSQLAEKQIVSKTEVEMAKAKVDAAKAKVEEAQSLEYSAKLRLSLCDITAPFDGFVDRFPNKMGSLVDEGTLVTTLSDNNEILAYFNVSERDYLDFMKNLKLGAKTSEVELVLANGDLYDQRGLIETIDGQFDNETGTIAFRARFKNPERLLKHGASGKIRLERKIKDAVIIPQKSTFEIQDKIYVYVVNDKNELIAKNITISLRLPNIYIVESGIRKKDKILLEGIQLVREGLVIKPVMTDINRVLSDLRSINQ